MKKMTFDPSKLETPVTVLFDSSNAVSAHEIGFLKSKNTDGRLEFVDLSVLADRAADYGVSVEAEKEQLQARGASGSGVSCCRAPISAYAARKGVSQEPERNNEEMIVEAQKIRPAGFTIPVFIGSTIYLLTVGWSPGPVERKAADAGSGSVAYTLYVVLCIPLW